MTAPRINDYVVNADRLVIFGRLLHARADEGRRCVELRGDDGCLRALDLPAEWGDEVEALLGRDVVARARRSTAEAGLERAVLYSLREAAPGEIGASPPQRSIAELAAEQGYDLANPPDIAPALRELLPSPADAERFERELEALRGRSLD